MRDRVFNGAVTEGLRHFGRRLSAFSSDGRRLLPAAALLHVALAVGLFGAGRAQVAPSVVDRDGIVGSFALDSKHYQRDAARLAEIFKHGGVAEWAGAGEPLHAKLISILFLLLGPLFGHSTLSAEPFNLFCYVAVVGLTLALGREVGGARAGALAACVVALWPTFLLHTLQLLKDSLFIAAALALVLCVTTWLTRDYGPRAAVATGAVTAVAVSLLLLIRPNFAVVVIALALLGLVMLVVRQLAERRALYWNMACPALILAACAFLLLPSHAARDLRRFKHYPSDRGGQPKSVEGVGERVPAVVSYLPRVGREREPRTAYAGRLDAAAERAALKIGSARYRFSAIYAESGSNIDSGVRFRRPGDIFAYLPRAFQIGWWAPFPDTWAAAGMSVGVAGKLVAGAETLVMYAFELLALVAVVRPPRRLAAWLLLSVTAFGVTLLGLVVPNVGALYRFRYTFWLLLIVLGAKGFEAARESFGKASPGRRASVKRASAVASLVCLLVVGFACSPHAAPDGGAYDAGPRAQAASPAGTIAENAGGSGFELINFTGSTLRAVHVSPSESKGWEENVLGADELDDGDAVNIRFSPEGRAVLWDIRIESADAHYAEWKGLDLGDASRITLLLGAVGEPTAVAEIE
ncbi:MAG TPA: hypothetical protein VM936_19410 [Pyrinomonadaceae bacterium]|nr:hypothetical protein [Pyrinomonadaceae bacterium]